MMSPTVFPFTAVVGQERLKLALRLVAVDPRIGGVLVRGPKGIAKSTAARSIAALLARVDGRAVPFVDLPLGATEDRVVGSLDVTRALRDGERRFQPGLLATAHGGVLYVDEVNLLTDYLVDIILDAAATGVLVVERDGVSERLAARFQLVGTMNPEEGELRPQLLDRFALCADLEDLTSAEERSLAVRRRLRFDEDADAFWREFGAEETAEVERLVTARHALPRLALPDALLDAASAHAIAQGAVGLRSDLILCRAARAHAALSGADEVTWKDVEAVEALVLAHRRTQPPDDGAPARGDTPPPNPPAPGPPRAPTDDRERRWQPRLDAPAPRDARSPNVPRASHGPTTGRSRDRRRRLVPLADGRLRRALAHRGDLGVDVHATLLGRALEGPQALRSVLRLDRPPMFTIVCADASGSMGGGRRMAYAKGVLASAMIRAYQRRHTFALVAFRGAAACEVVGPTRGLRTMLHRIDALRTGGTTSVAAGLERTMMLIARERRREPALATSVIVVTDGRANRSVHGAHPLVEATAAARRLAAMPGLRSRVVDSDAGMVRLGLAESLAAALGADVEPLPGRSSR
ncbi:MAG: AAA family ATPase [Candidatus Rokubacteria bacterium]|nr:AAA family ATPase [Candidatus Rokubacteria bacterium]